MGHTLPTLYLGDGMINKSACAILPPQVCPPSTPTPSLVAAHSVCAAQCGSVSPASSASLAADMPALTLSPADGSNRASSRACRTAAAGKQRDEASVSKAWQTGSEKQKLSGGRAVATSQGVLTIHPCISVARGTAHQSNDCGTADGPLHMQCFKICVAKCWTHAQHINTHVD